MEESKSIRERLTQARQLQQAGHLAAAAAIYQKIVDSDVGNQEAVGRLLVTYRKLKEYRHELAVINTVLTAYAHRDKDLQAKWIREHPKAAGAGKSVLKQLGGAGLATVDPKVGKLQKRKDFVERRLSGKKAKVGFGAGKKKAKTTGIGTAKKNEAKIVARLHPSLFVISLTYIVSLDKIDAAMPSHMAFLNRHYDSGDFLVSGRQVPRTGGVIIAWGKDREAVHRLTSGDPLVKKKLATIDIVEFRVSQGLNNISPSHRRP